jgi:hypothetical protein
MLRLSATPSEGILKEWELGYLTKAHLAAKHGRGDSPQL